jgi:predicted glycogen debranching enzyme
MKPEIIRFDQSVCSRLDLALSREWLETNGLGGFASSTLIGLNTRRYHGLLTASTTPPSGRVLLLSKLEETIIVDDQRYELASNQYPGAIHPHGYQYLKEFRLDPFPVSIYRVAGLEIEKRVFMVHGENTTVIEYEVSSTETSGHPKCILELRPLIAFRDYHSTTHENNALNPALDVKEGAVSITAYSTLPPLFFAHNAQDLATDGRWYLNLEYLVERDRGLDFVEDLFQPFTLRFQLSRRSGAAVIASTEPHEVKSAAVLRERERSRREALADAAPADQPLVRALTAAADQYIVKRGSIKTIVAGYHWFTDWGRDTMIALPGLTLVTGRFSIAREILEAYSEKVSQGMIPNCFSESHETPEYNTADATLWFFEAIRAYLHYSADDAFVRERLYPQLKEIVDWHIRGTRYGIHVDADGLLACGEPGVQVTWMDAKVGEYVVTPRNGKPVEIQALWYNALRIMEHFARRFADPASETLFSGLAEDARESFNTCFWNDAAGCLYDVMGDGHADGSLRPNQIFAVSLRHTMLQPDKARSVVQVVEDALLTPMGLRTLPRRDPRYRERYEGGITERDTAYHLGTVWPWLMGPFITAYLKVNQRSEAALRQAEKWLAGFTDHLAAAGLGQICEIADAEYPHTPRGCIAQAWSVAEILRTAVEDVYARESQPGSAVKRPPAKFVPPPKLAKSAPTR